MLADSTLDLAERKVLLEGILLANFEQATIEMKDGALTCKLSIVDKSLIDRLLDTAPCFVGGEYLYRGQACLIGSINYIDGKPILSIVESGKLYINDKEFPF